MRVSGKVCLLVSVGLFLVSAGLFAAGGQETAKTGERMQITWMGHPHSYEGGVPPDGNPVELLLEERFDVDIVNAPLVINDREKVMLYFAEGKTADMINVFGADVGAELIDQGLVRTIPEQWLWDYMPEWMSLLISMYSKEIVEKEIKRYGDLYAVPYSNYAQPMPHIIAVRKDWMDAVGVSDPKTLDDFYEMFAKFTFEDPDGNGKDDTYGIGMYNWSKFQYIFGAFGTSVDKWYIKDGGGVYSSATREYREALSLLNDWYEAGIIDPEFVTDTRDDFRKKWSEGKLGYNVDHPWWMVASTTNDIITMVKNLNPNAEFTLLDAPVGPSGLAGVSMGEKNMFGQGAIFFGRNTSDEKVKKIMEIKEALCSADTTLYVRSYHGVEGVHYDIVDGVITYKSKEEVSPAERAKAGLGQFYALIPATFERHAMLTLAKEDAPFYAHSLQQPIFTHVGFRENTEIVQTKMADVQTIANEFFFKFITGAVNVNDNRAWDEYLSKLEAAGLSQLTDEFNRQLSE